MKKVRLIYNPGSGDKSFKNKLDNIIEEFQRGGFQIIPHKTLGIEDIDLAVKFTNNDDYYGIAVAGGDGTINRVVNAMIKYNIKLPVGIFPWGTANDFASYFGITRDIGNCCQNIISGKTRLIDLGRVNDNYFVNVAAGGLFTDISLKTDINLKNTLGKLAYYLKGLEQIPNFRPIPAQIVTSEGTLNENIYLFLAFNGSSAGGFNMLAKDAVIDDGKLDFIAIKACPLIELITLLINIIKGEHLNDSNIIYLRTDRISINCENDIEIDVDGEPGPLFPIDISVIPRSLEIFA